MLLLRRNFTPANVYREAFCLVIPDGVASADVKEFGASGVCDACAEQSDEALDAAILAALHK